MGEVVEVGEAVAGWRVGQRAGIAWLRHTCGRCVYCGRGEENLCPNSLYTGWDADGGFAEFATAPAEFAYPLPDGPAPARLAPLLCAGIIGFRTLRMTAGSLAIYGFGASAHLAAQVALAQGRSVHVVTRSAVAQRLARELGATTGPPRRTDSAILFAPAGELVPIARAPRPRRHAGRGGHPPDRHPAAELRAPPVPGARPAQRHGQLAGRRARVPFARR